MYETTIQLQAERLSRFALLVLGGLDIQQAGHRHLVLVKATL